MVRVNLLKDPLTASFDRPTKATLMVHLENGEEWEASQADLKKFGFVRRLDTYHRAHDMLLEAFGLEDYDDDSFVNDIRYVVECAVAYDHSPWADENGVPWPAEEDTSAADDLRARLRCVLAELSALPGRNDGR